MMVDEAVPTRAAGPTREPSPFDQADPELLRAMVELDGRVLDDLAGDVPAPRTLRDLCDSCRLVLDASRVTVELTGDPDRQVRTLLPPDGPLSTGARPGWLADDAGLDELAGLANLADPGAGPAGLPPARTATRSPAGDGSFRAEAPGPDRRPDEAEIAYRVGLTGPDGRAAGWLEAAWPVGHGRPTELDMAVVDRFSRLAVLVVARQRARRDQLLALARDRR